ncbi:MAG: iron chelate uptake ABC transporter family permease subunit, partial [Planctomycetota bacterium]
MQADLPSKLADFVEAMTFRSGYNTSLVVAGTALFGFAAGIVGVFALLRRRSLVADAISHAALPGIALAFLVAAWLGFEGRSFGVLLIGAAATGILGVLAMHGILRFSRLTEDAAIGIVLSVFFGAGVVGLTYIQANEPSGSAGIDHFIFGSAATMLRADVATMAALAAVAVIATVLLLKEFAIVCFNDSFARVDGWPVSLLDIAMMALVVLVTVAGLRAVGLIMVVAMLVIPPVAARFWTERLWKLVVISGSIGAGSAYFGAALSGTFSNMPTGPVIVLVAGAVFAISLICAPNRGAAASAIRRIALRLRIGGDHLLEFAHDLLNASDNNSLDRPAIERLSHRRGWSPVFRALVLRRLQRRGLLVRDAASETYRVTDVGRERGRRVARNHALWERYLISYADVAPSHVDWSVDQVEHVLSDELVDELERELAAARDAGEVSDIEGG